MRARAAGTIVFLTLATAVATGGPSGGASGIFLPFVATPTGSWPEAVAIGDVSGDGRNDVVMVTSYFVDPENDFKLFVFRQVAGGTLAPPVKLATLADYVHRPTTVAVGDINGDGRNDVVVGNTGATIGVYYQTVSGDLADVALHDCTNSAFVRVADLDDDGRLDVVGLGRHVSVLRQRPDGTLAPPVEYPVPAGGGDLEVGDLNRDGRTDVVVAAGGGDAATRISVLYQQPDGTLGGLISRTVPGSPAGGIGIGDLNGDGRLDLAVSYGDTTMPTDQLGVFYQDATGGLPATLLSRPSYHVPEPVVVADITDDRLADVLVAHGGWEQLGIYYQVPGGLLIGEQLAPIPYASHYNPHGLAVGDISGDGAPDVVIADYSAGLVVLHHIPVAPLAQRYHTVTPCRLLDTRTAARPIEANTYRTFEATGACAVPADARAVALNVTAVNPGAVGDYRLYPAGDSVLPTSSTLNFAPGRTRANNAVVPLGTGGAITVRCDMPVGSTASVHLVVDVVGYFRAD